MAEHIAIEQGRQPWQPAEDAELVEVLHQYDMPLIGVIRHGTSLHLFRCIEGHTDASQLWAYTPLSPEELDRLRADDGDLDVLVADLSARRPTVLALASGDRGVTLSALVADPSGSIMGPRFEEATEMFGRKKAKSSEVFVPNEVALVMEHFEELQAAYGKVRPNRAPTEALKAAIHDVFDGVESSQVMAFLDSERDKKLWSMMLTSLEELYGQLGSLMGSDF